MSLYDAVDTKEIPCKIPGCKRTWKLSPKQMVESWKSENYQFPKRMCDVCKDEFDKIELKEVSCSTKDCEAKISISPYQQLVLKRKHKPLERETFFCEDCKEFLKTVEDVQVECRMKPCHNTWTWFASSRLKAGGRALEAQPDNRLCGPCFKKMTSFKEENRPCKLPECDRIWKLDRMTQLEWSLENKPERERLCKACKDLLKSLSPLKQPCKVNGCDQTWEWATYSQLRFQRQKDKDPKLTIPERYCESCFTLSKRLQPLTIHCSKKSCEETITFSVEEQLELHAQKQKPQHLHRLCPKCVKEQSKLKPKPMICKEDGCGQTWMWTPEDQFESGVYQDKKFVIGETPVHYCQRCHDFIESHHDEHVPCQECEEPIFWTVHQQLKTELGQWAAPTLCPNCLKNGVIPKEVSTTS